MNKYRNRKTLFQGILFDSQLEASRYREILWMAQAGIVANIELQPKYNITINDSHICSYIADFRYTEVAAGQIIVEDCKSPATRTAVYRLKKKLVRALYGVEIVEVIV